MRDEREESERAGGRREGGRGESARREHEEANEGGREEEGQGTEKLRFRGAKWSPSSPRCCGQGSLTSPTTPGSPLSAPGERRRRGWGRGKGEGVF